MYKHTLEPTTSPGEISQWPMLKIVYRTDPDGMPQLLPPGQAGGPIRA